MRDFLQAASNTAADTVAAPVDLIAFLLRKAGVPVPQNAVGGTQWMTERGLRRDVQQSPASLAGETVSLLSPVAAAAKAPQIARGLLQMEANAAAPKTLRPEAGAIVWHGSPHKFDRFDASKIGTGEGAQAYGHGLYLAESPDVAKIYKDTLAYKAFDLKPEAEARGLALSAGARGEFIRQAQANVDPVVAARRLQNANISARGLPQDKLAELFAAYQKDGGGQLYKVDLPDKKIARMLDWDKPLSQQGEAVRKNLSALDKKDYGNVLWQMERGISGNGTLAGRDLYDLLAANLRDSSATKASDGYWQAAGSAKLRELGIPGIRYLDGGSRGAGAGTSNFVVFPGEEQYLRILERNGGLLSP